MAAKRTNNTRELDAPSIFILQKLKEQFIEAGLDAKALHNGYVGVPIVSLTGVIRANTGVSQVDFDLCFKSLEERELISTGPRVPYDNRPGSGVFIMGLFSKREYASLTEAGYRAAQQSPEPPKAKRPPSPQIHISGGNFHQSQIALGEQVSQQQRNENVNSDDVMQRLILLLEKNGSQIDDATREDVRRVVTLAEEGDTKEAKPILQKLFSFASETVKQEAWAILTTLITKALGL